MINQFSILHDKNKKQHVESIVAMAVYQADNAKWLREAIDSITKQTYTNFLFVIVIDGPVPQAISGVLNDAVKRDDRIILTQNSHNIGLASCMNAVIDFSMQFKPTFFVRMDADDISEEHRLLRQITYLKRHSNISVLGSALTEINESGFKVGARVMPASHKQIVRILPRRSHLTILP